MTPQTTMASSAAPHPTQLGLSRRRFLQAAGVAGAASLLPAWLAEAAEAATPIGANDGVLVLLTMAGGNDGLNTFVPIANGAYYDARPNLAISPSQALHLTGSRGLHPKLGYMKALWDQGRMAVVDGVGQPGSDLSHFVSMGRLMAANGNGQAGSTGWLGRVLDGLPREPLTGLSIGSTVPLVLNGAATQANSVPADGGHVRNIDRSDAVAAIQWNQLTAMSNMSTGLGQWADATLAGFGEAYELSGDIAPHIPGETEEAKVVRSMRLAANLINANVGIRVISILFGDFDSHANQAYMHAERMQELNAALEAFFTTLSPGFADRTLVVGTSEFGRRVASNANGTDHGTSNSMFAIGSRVKGGFYGQMPSLTNLDSHGNMAYHVDYRQFYGNIATTWLGADSAQVLGANHADLGFLRSPGQSSSTTTASFPGAPTPRRTKRAEVARLYLAYFGRTPDEDGLDYWAEVRDSGQTLAQISESFASSDEFRKRFGSLNNRQFVELAYRNVLNRNGDTGGINHWTSILNQGTSRGQVMIGFSESVEFRNKTADKLARVDEVGPVGRLYQAFFTRKPDEAGLDHWINTGLNRVQVAQEFASSSEFKGRYGTLNNTEFVRLVYRNVLGREPDSAGLNHWVGALNRGASRGEVMLGFSDSAEFVRKVYAS